PEGAVRTADDTLRRASGRGELGAVPAWRDAPDLADVVIGEPQGAVRAAGDRTGEHRAKGSRGMQGEEGDLPTGSEASQQVRPIAGEPDVAVRAARNALQDEAARSGDRELGEVPDGRDPPDQHRGHA